ncbi:MAG: hypothetical protein HY555_00075 [Euryarchaeota archaeon]|nr:hypothetical protein [Euryarchaeota archaeon]
MVRGRFCYLCGKVTEELVENRCRECYLRGGRFLTLPERLEARVCRNCHTYLKGGRWLPIGEGLEEVIKNAALDTVKESIRLEKVEAPEVRVSVEGPKESSPTVYLVPCAVEVEGRVAGFGYSARQEAAVRVVLDLCQDCSRASGKYYEAILQVRGEGALGQEERDRVYALVGELMAQYARTDRKAFVSKFEDLKGGFDFYMGSVQVARKVASALQERFGGAVGESPKLTGKDGHGKDVYRVAIVLRLPRFRTGDILGLGGEVYQLLGLTTGKATLFDLGARKRATMPAKGLREAEILGREEDIRKAMISEATTGRIQVMDLESLETIYFEGRFPVKIRDEVRIFRGAKDYILRLEGEE